MHKRSLHIFRRDLRLHDNTALNHALLSSKEVVTCFIFNDAQVGAHKHRSANGLAFLIESLEELADEIKECGGKLLVLHGDPTDTIETLAKELSIDSIFFNKDYTPFSRKRDDALQKLCERLNIPCSVHSDLLLCEPSEFGKDDGKPYTVYTPFFKKASKLPVPKPSPMAKGVLANPKISLPLVSPRSFWPETSAPKRLSLGGRSKGVAILETIPSYKNYEEERNLPAMKGTTLLAPHNKFGTLSIREVYHAVADSLGTVHTLVRELYWRDFFTHIAWHFPHVFGHAFNRAYDAIAWSKNMSHFEAWCEGRTGFPIVDAGMRELVTTGFMHNRVRMIVASFLVKDLHLSWRWGEAFFARHLTDYDPSVNNGSWQWAASTGCDAQPYFRIFNPWLQQKRFDPDCIYVKRWIPELGQISPKIIHKLHEEESGRPTNYPAPIIEHALQKIHAEEMFRECIKASSKKS
jgi:deoxyribodipyrimidine photo-lyase